MNSWHEEELGPFLQSLLSGRRPAWLRTTLEGAVLSGAGELEHYGLEAMQSGTSLLHRLDVLEGIFPLERGTSQLPHLQLPHLQWNEHQWIDVHVLLRGDEARILILDSTPDVEHKSLLQQRGNDLALLLERTAGRVGGAGSAPPGPSQISHEIDAAGLLAEMLDSLSVVVLESLGEGLFRYVGSPNRPNASWLAEAWVGDGWRSGLIRIADSVPFLENFLYDAEVHWDSGSQIPLRSGAWVRTPEDGGAEIAMEAQALNLESGGRPRRLLIVQRLGGSFEERRTLIQRARETSLDYERMRKEVERKEILLHCIVHDLKGPLSGMMGGLSLLKSPTLDDEKRQRLIEMGLMQSKQQEDLIRTILEVFSAEVDSLRSFARDWENAPDVYACAAKGLSSYEPAFEEKQVRVVRVGGKDAEGRTLKAFGDKPRLIRIFQNLAENASRHAPRGTEVEVRVEAASADRENEGDEALEGVSDVVEITVSDRGPGVPPEVARGMFTKFGRQKSGDRAHVGAGLGLYFCGMTVEQWGGSIDYEDRPGGGATFRVRLPRVMPE